MILFLKLYLAHLVADFILQFEELYQLKVKSKLGHFFHVLAHFLTTALIIFPYLKYPSAWILVLAVSAIHYYQDLIKYSTQEKYPKSRFYCFSIDQIVHFFVIGIVFFFPFAKEQAIIPFSSTLEFLYNDSQITLVAIALILSTFGCTYWLFEMRNSFIPNSRQDHYITSFEMAHSLIERSFVTLTFLYVTQPILLAATLAIGILRLASPKLRSTFDFVLSFACAAGIGLLFRLWI